MKLLSNPVLVKELRRRMRSPRSMIIQTVYLSLIGIVTMLIYLAFDVSGTTSLEEGSTIGKAIFLSVITVALIQVCIITPSLTAGSIAGEKERQTYDVLVTTLLSARDIVFGKLGAALGFSTLLIITVLPLAGLSFLFGGVSGIELTVAMIGLLVTVLLYASIGLFWSTVMKSTLSATVMSQATIILPLLGIPFLFVITGIFFDSLDVMEDLVNTPVFVYAMGAILCSHPFIALGLTELALTEGENPFFFTVDPGRGDILVPSPWLAYLFIGLLLTMLFLFLSVRMLKPVDYGITKTNKTTS